MAAKLKRMMDDGVLKRLPSEWQMFLKYLESDMTKAEIVYNDMIFSQYGGQPQWSSLLKAMLDEEPCIEEDNLIFKPRLLKLSEKLQEHFFVFLVTHCSRIQDCDLTDFMEGIIKKCEITKLNMYGSFQQFTILMKTRVMHTEVLEAFYRRSRNQICKDMHERSLDPDVMLEDKDDNISDAEEFEKPAKRPRLEGKTTLSMQTTDTNKQREFPVSLEDSDLDRSGNHKAGESITVLNECGKNDSNQLDTCTNKLEDTDTLASRETFDLIKRLAEDLVSDRNDLLEKDLQELTTLTVKDTELVCQSVDFSLITDQVVYSVCELISAMWKDFSSTAICVLLETILLNRIETLAQNASRQLILAITLTAAKFPKQFIDAVMVPGLTIQSELTRYKSEIYITVTKESLSSGTRLYFIEKLVTSSIKFTENNLNVLQCVIDQDCEFNTEVFHKFLQLLYGARFDFMKNLKFGKLLLSIAIKHGKDIGKWDLMEKIVASHSTFLKKTILITLKKIKA